jgi:hypothetical protein
MLSLTIKMKNLAMLWERHGTNFFHIKFFSCTNINCQNGPGMEMECGQHWSILTVDFQLRFFYFNGQALKGQKFFQGTE